MVKIVCILHMNIAMKYAKMKNKKYNHAFSIAFSLDSDMTDEEWYKYMETKKGLSELGAHLIRRIQQVIEDKEAEAYDIHDTYEN